MFPGMARSALILKRRQRAGVEHSSDIAARMREIRAALEAIIRAGGRGRLLSQGYQSDAIARLLDGIGIQATDVHTAHSKNEPNFSPQFDIGLLVLRSAHNDVESQMQQLLDRLKPGAWMAVAFFARSQRPRPHRGTQWNGIQVDAFDKHVVWGRKALALPASCMEACRDAGYRKTKAIADCVIGFTLLLITLPLQLLIALLIKLTSPGPAIFRQTRVGKNGRLFTFYKFRTMWMDALERFPSMYEYRFSLDQIATMKFKSEDDPRHTPFGRWLRKSSLDELPNLINVVRGEISLIGPRPDIPEMVVHYRSDQLAKLSVKPGITGRAQARGRGDLTFQQTLDLGLEYVRTCWLWTDIRVIHETILCLLSRTGAI